MYTDPSNLSNKPRDEKKPSFKEYDNVLLTKENAMNKHGQEYDKVLLFSL